MAASVVQSNSALTTTTPATVVLGSAPTAGNTLLAIMASDTTSSAVPFAGSGLVYTQRLAQVSAQGFYVWTRLVVSGDSATTTFTPNGANVAALAVLEISGTYDKIGAGFTTVANLATTVATSGLSPTTTDGLVVAIAGLHSFAGGTPSGGAVDNTFTFLLSRFSAAAGSTTCGTVDGYKVTSSTATTGTTNLSWTTTANDRDAVQIAFTGLAGGAPAALPDLVMAYRI
jgi:hypothetical protein